MPPSMSAHGYDTPDLTKEELTDRGASIVVLVHTLFMLTVRSH